MDRICIVYPVLVGFWIILIFGVVLGRSGAHGLDPVCVKIGRFQFLRSSVPAAHIEIWEVTKI